jgi:shikimate dehydrogenase
MMKAGVMGWPVEHSLSPKLHGFWLKHYGIEGVYEKLPVPPEELGQTLRQLSARGFRGVNLTMPHKEAALAFIEHIDPRARKIGAVNTVVVRADGMLEGRNTDIYGFAQSLLAEGYAPAGKPAVLLGAGGAARAGIEALLELGVAEIRVLNRTQGRAEALRQIFGNAVKVFSWSDTQRAFDGAGLLANATSLGMKGQPPLDISLNGLPPDAFVADMVNVPAETALLRQARRRGYAMADGLDMLLHQARPAFEAFFGRDPEVTDELRHFVLAG